MFHFLTNYIFLTMRLRFFALTLFSILFLSNSLHAQNDNLNEQLAKFNVLMRTIDNGYVDTVNNSQLVETAIVKVLEQLDPHSVYISKEEVEKTNEPLKGNFEGVGIQFNLFKDTILVVAVISGGPSEKVGIMAGDKIVMIDDSLVAGIGMTNNDVISMLRGDKGTKVSVQIKRNSLPDLIDFHIVRDKIPLYSVDAAYMVDNSIGYIKLNKFSATTIEEFNDAAKRLEDQGMKSLILDLQNNGGGYLNAAVGLADEFLNDDKLIVYTEGLHQNRQNYNATDKGFFQKGKLVVLINESSASASEIVAGAIQDWDRGLIIGRTSFGKGLVQKPFYLNDGSMVRLTIARYYTPSGRCIQRPYTDSRTDYYKEISNRLETGGLMYADSVHFPDSLKYYTNDHRLVYGGGGIFPDVFVPLDTTINSELYGQLIRKGTLNNFVLSYVDRNRNELMEQYPNFDVYDKNFKVNDVVLDELWKAAEPDSIKPDETGLKASGELIRFQIKALIARGLYDQADYFKVINNENDAFVKAVEVLKKGNFKDYGLSTK